MTKKKGQKWGTEKTGFSKRYARDLNEEEDTYYTQPAEAETLANGQIDYEQLVAYTGSVKVCLIVFTLTCVVYSFNIVVLLTSDLLMFQKGDIIAYRLIELTSSWTPEVSSFRVKFLTLLLSLLIKSIPKPLYVIFLL